MHLFIRVMDGVMESCVMSNCGSYKYMHLVFKDDIDRLMKGIS